MSHFIINRLKKSRNYELKCHKGNYNRLMTIPKESYPVIEWWIFPPVTNRFLTKHQNLFYIQMPLKMGGEHSMNLIELKACQLSLQSFCKDIANCHMRVYMDNITSCAYINKLGGKKNRS